jgi:hypothetical protein
MQTLLPSYLLGTALSVLNQTPQRNEHRNNRRRTMMALAPCSLALAATRWHRFWGINLICLKVSIFVLFLPYYYSKTSLGSLGYILTLTLLLDLITFRNCFA